MRALTQRDALLTSLALAALLHGCAQEVLETDVEAANQALSTTTPSYLQAVANSVTLTPLLSVGDTVSKKPDGTPYRMVGIPDGLGVFSDEGDEDEEEDEHSADRDSERGTFTVLMNHELTSSAGSVRAHGAKGAFISKWTFDKQTLQALRGEDLVQAVSTYNAATSSWNPPAKGIAFTRFCSADLPSQRAFYNRQTKRGTKDRIFMNGEESGAEGRAFAHVVTGAEAGTSYELPHLGKFSWENSVANPGTGDVTLVAGTDDSGGGQVYFYLGKKTSTGTAIERAGLVGGTLYALQLTGITTESDATTLATTQQFQLVSLGNVASLTGAQLQAATVSAGATAFQRPEDAAWNESSPNEFYFNTTASFTNKTRSWRLKFRDLKNAAAGGTAELLVDGGTPKMLDNMAIDRKGRTAVLQEDPGGQDHLAKIWGVDLRDRSLTQLAQFDPAKFTPGAPGFLTNDEESSGVVDVSKIFGNGAYLLDAQVHKSNTDPELVEEGQLLLMRVRGR